MEKTLMIVPLLALMAGCATKEMKSTPFYEGTDVTYTGKPEDRVNAWPVAYWREPVGSVLWPLTSFSDDHFALRPIYSQYKQAGKDGEFDEFNFLWPLCQADTKHDDYYVFPFFWGWDSMDRPYQALFPVYWNGADYNSLFPLWIYSNSRDKSHLSVLFGMAGNSAKKDGYEANWCFPLWYWNNRGTFVTTVCGRWKNGWAVPPLLSWGESETNGNYRAQILLGFGGAKRTGSGIEHWAFPLYKHEELLCYGSNRLCRTRLLLNLVGWESKGDQLRSSYAFPLYSWHADESFLTPLFYWDKEGSLFTPLGGRTVNHGTTNVFVTPIVKHTTGRRTGGMVFPLWSRTADSDFREKAGKLDCDRLPEDIRIWMDTSTNMVWSQKKNCEEPVVSTRRRADRTDGADNTDWLLLFSWHDRVRGHLGYGSHTNAYELTRKIERGHWLLLDYEYERTAEFSAIERTKKADEETTDTSFLVWLYNYKWNHDRRKNDTYARHRVLWRLWDWEEKNGDVALDVFPGFTYDSKTNGYSKTSFLWRAFRYERDPEKGMAVDLLFIPLWR